MAAPFVNAAVDAMIAKLGLLAICLLAATANVIGADAPARGYYEFRIYAATTNKLEAVVERFRNTVDPARRRHGIETLGYWTAPGSTNGGIFAYLISAESKVELQKKEKAFGADAQFQEGYAASNARHGKTVDKVLALPLALDGAEKFDFSPAHEARAFDLRIYSVLPGKLDAFRNRWRDIAAPIYDRHGLHSLGWWVAEEKDAAGNDQFICLLAGKSVASILQSISDFHQDPAWIRVERETEASGKLRSGVTAYKLTPTDFSTLK
jgi:hypothetical protein